MIVEDVIQINGVITINVNGRAKRIIYVKNIYIWNPATCRCENSKYLASVNYDSRIMCDQIIDESHDEEIKTVTTNFNEKNVISKAKNFYIVLTFSLITITLLIAGSIYGYRAKQKHLLPFFITNNRLKTFYTNNML